MAKSPFFSHLESLYNKIRANNEIDLICIMIMMILLPIVSLLSSIVGPNAAFALCIGS